MKKKVGKYKQQQKGLIGKSVLTDNAMASGSYSHSLFSLLPLQFLLLLSSSSSSSSAVAVGHCDKPAVLFLFGDSNSDTGGLASGLGFPINLPNGRTFFHRSTGRLSDGRILIDLLCKEIIHYLFSFLYFRFIYQIPETRNIALIS